MREKMNRKPCPKVRRRDSNPSLGGMAQEFIHLISFVPT
jgi:hypothetical protein